MLAAGAPSVLKATFAAEGIAQVIVGHRIVGPQAHGRLEAGDGLRRPALRLVGVAQVEVGFGKLGSPAQGCPVAGDCFLDPPLQSEDESEVVVRLGIAGLQAQGLPKTGHSFVPPAQVGEDIAQMVVSFREVGPASKGLSVACHGLVPPVQGDVNRGAAGVVLGSVGFDGQGLADQGQGSLSLVLPRLVGQHSQQVQCVGLSRIGLQDLPEGGRARTGETWRVPFSERPAGGSRFRGRFSPAWPKDRGYFRLLQGVRLARGFTVPCGKGRHLLPLPA